MKILVDLSYIHSKDKLNESVALYALRFLRSLSEVERQNFILLITPDMENYILERTGNFTTLYFKDINKKLLRIPYVRGFLRKKNWIKQIETLNLQEFTGIYIPFCWSGNSGSVKIPKVITVHDLRPMKEPNRAFTGTLFFKSFGLRKVYLNAIRKYYTTHMVNATNVIAISEYVASEIKKEWPEYSNKVRTVYNSVTKSNIKPTKINSLENVKFILYVNTLTEYKNIITLVRAFAEMKKNFGSDLKLVVVGKQTDYWSNTIIPVLKSKEVFRDVIHINYAQKEELIWLYQNARIFITPSIHEGFGYTPIEAALEDCPVISSRCESLPDVTAEMVMYYNPPTSFQELSKQIKHELDYPTSKQKLYAISKYFAHRYSPDTHKQKIINILNRL